MGQRYKTIVAELAERVPEIAAACRVERPITYVIFEGDLIRFLIELVQNPSKHWRLREVMDWLEELIADADSDVRDLISISFCEWLMSENEKYLQQFWPFMGESLRQGCRNDAPNFCVSKENLSLLKQPAKRRSANVHKHK
ncbi:MAG: hypothetical protein KY445_16005 [Armatimonadetes bacterium]|nr:hypothetical protein [Armatimonadota bacterium]